MPSIRGSVKVTVSTHAPLRQRGERCNALAKVRVMACFNPRPASSARRTSLRWIAAAGRSFNPRPASSARRTLRPRRRHRPKEFQPTPRFVSEANPQSPHADRIRDRFNPRPASSARRTDLAEELAKPDCFNPRPASSARRTTRVEQQRPLGDVSTHAPLRQRGERGEGSAAVRESFQPTPRFVSEANGRAEVRAPGSFNPRPASSARRTPVGRTGKRHRWFQPTPRFVSEANPGLARNPQRRSFNPRPASSARRTMSRPCIIRSSHCFNPRPASSARRTIDVPAISD